VLLADLVDTSHAVAGTRARSEKRALLADLLTRCPADEIGLAVAYLAGETPQRRTGIGWRSLAEAPEPAAQPTLTLTEVDAALDQLSRLAGPGSQAARRTALAALMSRATSTEQDLLRRLLTGELRQGALDALVLDALAVAVDVPAADVRRAAMLLGSSTTTARVAVEPGQAGLLAARLEVGRPVRPMLAASAADVDAAMDKLAADGSPVVADAKLDGIRVQVHKDGDRVLVVTRTLDEITDRVPEVVEAVRTLPAERAVLDGEAIALQADGRPHPFQVTSARTASRADIPALRQATPLSTYLFDVLHLDGDDLMSQSLAARAEALAQLAPAELVVPRRHTADRTEVADFFADVVARGHEGVVIKDPSAPYDAGRRGSAWVKVKPRHTLDLVVLAAEWGHGRRTGWLSNIHLGARDPDAGGFVMLGKTFKGMTDELLRWQTERLLELEESRDGIVVHVRPELVVEIAFDGLQGSTRYPGGLALRFARVLRYRDDKTAGEADTIATVRAFAPAPR